MALVSVTPLVVQVRCDWLTGAPRRLRLGHEDLPVLAVARVRREAAAYPVSTGPRTDFEVVVPRSRLMLTFEHRSRRWLLRALDPDAAGAPDPSDLPAVA